VSPTDLSALVTSHSFSPVLNTSCFTCSALGRCKNFNQEGTNYCKAHQKVEGVEEEEGHQGAGAVVEGGVPDDHPVNFSLGKVDVDMFFLPCSVADLRYMGLYLASSGNPPLKIYASRPGYLQLCHTPIAIFVPIPEKVEVQEFKHRVCNSLWRNGVEIPLPTSHPFQNTYNGSVVAKRSLKISTAQAQASLKEVGVKEVWLGQFGTKTPEMIFDQAGL